jgi:hypothetical protein
MEKTTNTLTRQEAINKLVDDDLDSFVTGHQQGDDSYAAALLEFGHKGYADYTNEELTSELHERFDLMHLEEFEVIDEYDLYCEECGWIGNEDELKTVMLENENNPQDKTLYESKVCPECEKNNFSK